MGNFDKILNQAFLKSAGDSSVSAMKAGILHPLSALHE